MKLYVFLLFFILLWSGCGTVLKNNGYEKIEKITEQINETKKEYQIKLELNQKNLTQKYEDIIYKQNKDAQDANVFVYGILNLSGMKTPKLRIDSLIEYKSRAAFNLLPPPTPEQLIKENDEIRKELDETKVSLNDLQIKYSQIELENVKKREETSLAKSELEKIKKEKNQLREELSGKVIELQELRNKISEGELIQSAERERLAKENKEMRAKIAYSAAALGAILLIAGIAILKNLTFSIIGGAALAFSLFVATAPTWILWAIPLALLLLTGTVLFYKYNKEKILNSDILRAIQRFKDSSKEVYQEKLKPILLDEQGNYNKNGEVTENKDKSLEIDKRLMEMNIK